MKSDLEEIRASAAMIIEKVDALLTAEPEPEQPTGTGTFAMANMVLTNYVALPITDPQFPVGSYVELEAGEAKGTVEHEFTGPDGFYEIFYDYYDEDDGTPIFNLILPGAGGFQWVPPGSANEVKSSYVYAANLKTGDKISITGYRDRGAPARLTSLTIRTPVPVTEEPPATGDELTADSVSSLLAALGGAKGGDVIKLAAGDYGDLDLTGALFGEGEPPVTIEGNATFAAILQERCSGITWRSVTAKQWRATSCQRMALEGATITGIVYAKLVDGLRIVDNKINGNFHAVLLNDVSNFEVSSNVIAGAQEDLMRITGDSFNGIVELNRFRDTVPEDYRNDDDPTTEGYNHSDFIQMFGANGKTPHDITIRRNLMFDDRSTGAKTVTPQGIFISDPAAGGYKNLLIEENLIAVNSVNSIYINGGQENVRVRRNTLIPLNGGGAIIRLVNKAGMDNSGTFVDKNVCKVLDVQTPKATVSGNYVYGRDADASLIFSGDGEYWGDYMPLAASDLSAMDVGAVNFLSDLARGSVILP